MNFKLNSSGYSGFGGLGGYGGIGGYGGGQIVSVAQPQVYVQPQVLKILD